MNSSDALNGSSVVEDVDTVADDVDELAEAVTVVEVGDAALTVTSPSVTRVTGAVVLVWKDEGSAKKQSSSQKPHMPSM